MVVPQSIAGWCIMEHPNLTWMRTGGMPISGNLHICNNWWRRNSTAKTCSVKSQSNKQPG